MPKVTLTEEMQGLVGKEGMHVLADGTKFHYTARASHLLDARPWYDPNFFKARTTLFQSVSGQWLQVENSADYVNEPNPFTLASSHPKPRITMISSSPFSVDFFPEGGVPPKPSEELLRLYPPPMEDVAARNTPGGVAAPRTPEDENAQNTRGREPTEHQGREPAEHQGREPAEHKGREPAEHQGPEPDGDEPAMLPQGLEQEELEAYAANNAAEQLRGLDRRDPVPRSQPEGPPSAEEVAAHNLTHVPFPRWCESCVVPGPNNGAVILHRAAEEVTRFTISLHGEEAIILHSDGEPAIKAVARAVAAARSKLGKKTLQRTTPVAAHQSNGGAERAVQTVRRLGTCLFHALELKAGLPGRHTVETLGPGARSLSLQPVPRATWGPADPLRVGLWRPEVQQGFVRFWGNCLRTSCPDTQRRAQVDQRPVGWYERHLRGEPPDDHLQPHPERERAPSHRGAAAHGEPGGGHVHHWLALEPRPRGAAPTAQEGAATSRSSPNT